MRTYLQTYAPLTIFAEILLGVERESLFGGAPAVRVWEVGTGGGG